MKPYHDFLHDEGEAILTERRHERHDAECCTGCGGLLADHAPPAAVCRQLYDLLELVIDWHLGEEQARAKLRDAADAEIERRTGGGR